ncbi:hypothetical protein HU200_035671 [Digitaria exilis]|uniref:F-box domain-containing protein n=1 Tax=Digitaria exilis TaxID=1010633 RepID=A0A835EJ35_9POAL|nr:hypothetical protein HU200_035671 [Digitaria exilis]CAB3467111.1 unnamed protein product [Digitaria exilis]
MDSSTVVEEAAPRSAKPTTPSDAGDVDLISGLNDDVLLRVLSLLPDASDAVRTGALSRRWRGLWSRVPALRFASRPGAGATTGGEQRAALERYAAFVDGFVSRRAQPGCAAIESLSIVYATGSSDVLEKPPPPPVFVARVIFAIGRPHETNDRDTQRRQLMPTYVHAVQGWIQNAFLHGVKSFSVDLRLPPNSWRQHGGDHDDDENVVLLEGLHSPARLETLRLALGGAIRLRLPSTVKFASLAHLSLERITIAADRGDGARLLGHLVSSATCLHLQKLCMRNINLHAFSEEMRLEAAMLSELCMEGVKTVMSLKLWTPKLRVLHMYTCSHMMLMISAPKLEELVISFQQGYPPRCLEIQGGLLCVRSLKICPWSHRPCAINLYEDENDTNISVLKHCGLLTCLDVTLLRGQNVSFAASYLGTCQIKYPMMTSFKEYLLS